jgi:beta-phosphoglucomutase-like phosphatase (HAD superfamily)
MFSNEIKGYLLQNNFPTFSPKAVFFDMDGVLFDSMKHHAYAWVEALRQVGLPFTEYEAYMNEGRTGSSTINEVFRKHYGRDATEAEKQTIYKLKSQLFESRNESEQIPYVADLLKKIQEQKLQIHIVTGSGQVSLLESLEANFPGIFTKE